MEQTSEDEMRVVSGGSNPSSSGSSCSESDERESEAKRLGEMELHAARALADFAQMAQMERSKKRIKRGSAKARAWGEVNSQDLNLNLSKSEHEHLRDDDDPDHKDGEAMVRETIKVEQNSDLSVSNISSLSGHVSCFGRRMKQNMTEAEREAKRIRRVLANRESARQTIRRRQALREELLKSVADLSLENQNMKVEKELIIKEYLSLKERNKELKEQMTKAVKFEVESEIISRHVETSTSPSTELSLVAPGNSSGVTWPPWISISSDSAACYNEEWSSRSGLSRNLLYVPPCAWFSPLLNRTSESNLPGSQALSDTGVDFIAGQHGFRHWHQAGNLLMASPHFERNRNDLTAEKAAIGEEENTGINLEEMPVGFDRHDDISEHNSVVPTQSHEGAHSCHDGTGEQELDRKVDRETAQHEPAEISQLASIPFKKLVDPCAATAARKRRMELRKLKYFHGNEVKFFG